MLDFDSVKENAQGRWISIFRALGMDVREDGRHGPCPACAGEDRFRIDDKDGRGTYFCSQCGPGDGVDLVQKVLEIEFKEAMVAIADVVGGCEKNIAPKEKTITPEFLRKIFVESDVINEASLAGAYLKSRGLKTFPPTLRLSKKCWEPETKKEMNAMLAVFTMPDGKAATMHRTFLSPDGNKADIKKAKKLFPSLQKMTGGAIRLFEAGETVAIAEGIETAIAVKEMMNIPCWSVVSSTLVETFDPPKGIKTVIVCADNDKNFAGQKAAYVLANRLALKKINVTVMIPDKPGTDYLDELE